MTTTAHLTALADQLSAATTHARRVLRDTARRAGGGRIFDVTGNRWLTAQATVLVDALTAGTAQVCPHIDPNPRVIHAAAWAPGVLACPACVRMLAPTATEDTTCDRCRQHAQMLHPGLVAFGPVLLGYGLCTRCVQVTGLHPGREARR